MVESIPGPDRAMLYVLAAWTGFRKGELGSLTLRSLRLDDDPPTATVAACYSKRRREDTQVLHPEVVRQLKEWLGTGDRLGPDKPLFPVSGRVPGGVQRKTSKMIERDLMAARDKWLDEAKDDPVELKRRLQSDFLCFCNHDGLYADFHSLRHWFVTGLARGRLAENGPNPGQALRHPAYARRLHARGNARSQRGDRVVAGAAGSRGTRVYVRAEVRCITRALWGRFARAHRRYRTSSQAQRETGCNRDWPSAQPHAARDGCRRALA